MTNTIISYYILLPITILLLFIIIGYILIKKELKQFPEKRKESINKIEVIVIMLVTFTICDLSIIRVIYR